MHLSANVISGKKYVMNSTTNNRTFLLPCPMCGAVWPSIQVRWIGFTHVYNGAFSAGYRGECCDCGLITRAFNDETEAIKAWNTRAAIEFDNWFYLPKPKEGIVQYGDSEITRTKNGFKIQHIVDVINEAARKWGDELGEYTVKRICEAWNTERICSLIDDGNLLHCSNCGGAAESQSWTYWKYCPNCGSKVVSK